MKLISAQPTSSRSTVQSEATQLALLVVGLLIGWTPAIPDVEGAIFTVTRIDSTGPGSFPVVLNQAIAAPGDSTIEFAVSGTITLIAPLPLITKNLTINGRDGVVLSGASTLPLLTFAQGTTNTLSKLVLTGGFRPSGNGSAISNAGALFVDSCTFTNNNAPNGSGGAIHSTGPLAVVNSSLTKCSAMTGGAIACYSDLMVSSSGFHQNQASAGSGGAVYSEGAALTSLSSSTFSENQASQDGGGVCFKSGRIRLVGCPFVANQAGRDGGAVYLGTGSVEITDCSFVTNQGIGNGGAVFNSGSCTISSTPMANNTAANGGGLYNLGQTSLWGLTVSSNRASGGLGGGVFNSGDLIISDTTVRANSSAAPFLSSGGSAGLGGGIFSRNGNIAATNSTFSGNIASGSHGAAAIAGLPGTMGQPGNGGGATSLASTESAGFSKGGQVGRGGGYGNDPDGSQSFSGAPGQNGGFGGGGGGGGGGVGVFVHFTDGSEWWGGGAGGAGGHGGFGGGDGGLGEPGGPMNGRYYGNGGASGGGGGGAGLGGGVFLENGAMTLVNCTIAENRVAGGLGGQPNGQPGRGIGGGLFNYQASVRIVNTLVAENHADSSPDLYGAFLSAGFNLIGRNEGATGLSINDYQNVAANLGPLQDNGGPTFTHALLQGSLAVDGGTSDGAPVTDQRGIARPRARCDIGAFQLTTVITPTLTWAKTAEIVYGTPLGADQLNAATEVTGTFVYTPTAGTILPAGSNHVLTVVFTPKDLANYTAVSNQVSINVLKAPQTINFPQIPSQKIGGPPIVLTAAASTGFPVTFTLVSGPATLTGNLLSFGSASGLVTVRASQSGDANYNAAPSVDCTFVVGVLPLPMITEQPSSLTVNPGDRVTLNVSAANGPLAYQWRFEGVPLPNETNPSLVLARVKQAQAGQYHVIVSNPSGSVTSLVATVQVKITAGTPGIVTQPRSQRIRSGGSATLSVLTTGEAPLTYQWYEGPSSDTAHPIPGAINSVYTTTALSESTSFWVSVGNALGTVDSDTASVSVFPPEAALLELRMTSGLPGLIIEGVVGTNYRIEYRSDSAGGNWTRLLDLALPSTPFVFVDAGATGRPARFYRVLVP